MIDSEFLDKAGRCNTCGAVVPLESLIRDKSYQNHYYHCVDCEASLEVERLDKKYLKTFLTGDYFGGENSVLKKLVRWVFG